MLHLHKFSYRLDGDNIRFGLNKDLGFDEKSRNENIRRIGEVCRSPYQYIHLEPRLRWDSTQVAKLFTDACAITITAFISPYISDRALVRELHEKSSLEFVEVFVDAPLEVVEGRDPKGLYKKARTGEIKGMSLAFVTRIHPHPTTLLLQEFTGISAPYEAPPTPEIHLKTNELDVTQSVAVIVEYLTSRGFV